MTQDLLTELRSAVDPDHTAVLVIDVQNDFCAPGGHTEANLGKNVADCQAVVEPIVRLVVGARRAGGFGRVRGVRVGGAGVRRRY